jgi:hypothetical protein
VRLDQLTMGHTSMLSHIQQDLALLSVTAVSVQPIEAHPL